MQYHSKNEEFVFLPKNHPSLRNILDMGGVSGGSRGPKGAELIFHGYLGKNVIHDATDEVGGENSVTKN